MTNERKRRWLPLFRLSDTFYDPEAVRTFQSTPLDFPSRAKHPVIAIILDWVIIVFLLAMTQWFFAVPDPPKAYFAVDDESLKRPIVPEVITANHATVINVIGPLTLLLLFELFFFFNPWNAYYMIKGLGESVAMSLFFISLLWVTVGGHIGLRPTFLTNCKPDPTKILPNVTYYDNSICTNNLGKFEYQGFPSGHSGTAFAGWMYFSLYICGKSKPFNGGAYAWRVLLALVPLAFALWISMTRVVDFHHFPFQIICGGLIGIAGALIAYRLNFGSHERWFFGTGRGDDHIPVHYTYMRTLEVEQELRQRLVNGAEAYPMSTQMAVRDDEASEGNA